MSNRAVLLCWLAGLLFGWFVYAPAYEKAERARIEAIVQEKCK